MATLRIHRENGSLHRRTNYDIYIDGKKIGDIGNGESQDIQLKSGEHSIKAKINWRGSNEKTFVLSEKEIKIYEITATPIVYRLFIAMLVIIPAHFILKLTDTFKYLIYLLIPLIPVYIYYQTIGKNKCLHIIDIQEGVID